MTKLLLRKFNAWHRLDSLKFEAEIESPEALIQAINEICAIPDQVKEDPVGEDEGDAMEEKEVIDLTFDDDVYTPPSLPSNTLQPQLCDNPAHLVHQIPPLAPSTIKAEDVPISLDATLSAANAIAGPSSIKLEDIPMDDIKPDTNHLDTLPEPTVILAKDESEMTLPVLLECLRVDELRSIVKQMQVKAVTKVGICTTTQCLSHSVLNFCVYQKPDMINALLRTSCTQSTLFEFATMKSKMKSTSNGTASTLVTSSAAILRQTTLPFRPTAEKRLRELALRIVGKCVRVDEGYHRFVRRANIMYFRLCVSSSPLVYYRSLFFIYIIVSFTF